MSSKRRRSKPARNLPPASRPGFQKPPVARPPSAEDTTALEPHASSATSTTQPDKEPVNLAAIVEEAEGLAAEAPMTLTDTGPATPADGSPEETVSPADMARAVHLAAEARDAYALGAEQARTAAEEAHALKADLEERMLAINDREARILARERDADAGFLSRHGEWLEQMSSGQTDAIVRIRDEVSRSLEKAFPELEERERRLHERESELLKREEQLGERERSLRISERRLAAESSVLEESRTSIASEPARRIATLEAEAAALESVRTELVRMLEEQAASLARADAERAALGGRSLVDLDTQISDLTRILAEARAEHAQCLSAEDQQGLRSLLREQKSWQKERLEMLTRQSELQSLADQAVNLADQARSSRTLADNRRITLEAYESEIDRLRTELEHLTDDRRASSPFPGCTARDVAGGTRLPRTTFRGSLPELTKSLQHTIAMDKKLYYPERVVRSFIAGMHSSQLHLLQGISGTGKTSLPRAIAEAMGAREVVVEVQAGWRDRQDLLGYYNPFENRFVESQFLLALYEAQIGTNAKLPTFIVLDEMNLSYPEQYFADFLSQLELPEEERQIRLMTFSHPAAPGQLIDGQYLRIPSNVWYVGTANHDETTVGFAPKTFDRAHVMDLPDRYQEFPVNDARIKGPVLVDTLRDLFTKADRVRQPEADAAVTWLENSLQEVLRADFRLAWGNRITKQLRQYTAVVVAADGTIGEAVDDFVAQKILFRLRQKQQMTGVKLRALKTSIEHAWPELGDGTDPTECFRVLDHEIADKAT
jgi:hypothetical protein